MEGINRIAGVKNIIQENRPSRGDADEDINKLPHLKEYYKNFEDPAIQMEFESLLFPLEKMGYKQILIFRSFIVFRYKDIAEAIDLLSKNNNTWNHKFILGFKNKCFVCEDLEKNHIGFCKNKPESEDEHDFFERKDSLRPINIGSEKINEALKRMKSINPNSNNNNNNEIAIDNIDSDTCPICILELENNNIIILGCRHKFCRDCIVTYLEEEIKNSRVDPIKCPEKKCFNAKAAHDPNVLNGQTNINLSDSYLNYFMFSDDLVKSLVSIQYFDKYLDFKQKILIEKDKNLTFCPIPNCKGYGRIDSASLFNSGRSTSNNNLIKEDFLQNKDNNNDLDGYSGSKPLTFQKSQSFNKFGECIDKDFNEDDKLLREGLDNKNAPEPDTILNVSLEAQSKLKLVCNYNHEFCYRCKNPWNENHCCEKDEELFKFSNENAEKLKKCPNCRTWIEKNSGCNHMTCSVCKYEFCWLCMKECLPDHFNIVGTECYGKQFPEDETDPQFREAINELHNSSSFFFVFRLTFYLINYMHFIYFMPNAYNNENLNNNNNAQDDNDINNENNNQDANLNNNVRNNDLNNNNLNHHVIEIRDPNEDIPNANNIERENRLRTKFGFTMVILLCLFIFWFMMLFINGVLLFSMFKCLRIIFPAVNQNQASVNRMRSATRFILCSYLLIWLVFYLPGLFITTFWFFISVLYLLWLIVSL